MPQDRNTGAKARVFGRRMAGIVARKIGARKLDSDGNEYSWNGKRITIRSAHRDNAYVGALYAMLDRVDSVLAALETNAPGEFQVWEVSTQTFRANSKPQTKNPRIAQVATRLFLKEGHLIDKVRDRKEPETPEHGGFPAVDRSAVKTGSAFGESDEKAFWLNQTPLDRLEAVELLREIAFGYDPTTARLQRVLETAEFPPR
jgi:hypothetical protein